MELVEQPLPASIKFLAYALSKEPQDSTLWTYRAIAEFANGNGSAAKAAIVRAVKYGQVQTAVYNGIMEGQPFTANLGLIGKSVNVE
jgi:hypothetical protein